MRRILVLTNMYPPHHLGGYELSCRDCVERWQRDGYRVQVLTSRMRLSGVRDIGQNDVHRDLDIYWREHEMVKPSPVRRLAIERRNQRVLAQRLDEFRPDVVSVWHMGAMSQALLTAIDDRGLPMVLSVCDDWLVYGPRVDPWIRTFLDRPRLGRAVELLTGIPTRLPTLGAQHAFCFNSDFIRRRALEASRFRVETHTVVYSGIDPTDFPVGPAPHPQWRWRLLCVGRQEERKGTHVAVAALPELPEAHLHIVGPGDERYLRELRALADSLSVGERISFGQVERSELADVYAASDVLLFPVTWDEPFGLVPVEAMACGVPVIATGTGGSSEFLLHASNCLLVPARDPGALARAVHELAGDLALRQRLAEGGRVTARRLSVDQLARVLGSWHEAAATGFQAGRPKDLASPAVGLD